MGNGYEGSGGEGGRQSEPEEGSLREATLTWRKSEGLRGGKQVGKRGRERERTGREDMEGGRGRQGGKEGGRRERGGVGDAHNRDSAATAHHTPCKDRL
jgi:hypothetical protein